MDIPTGKIKKDTYKILATDNMLNHSVILIDEKRKKREKLAWKCYSNSELSILHLKKKSWRYILVKPMNISIL